MVEELACVPFQSQILTADMLQAGKHNERLEAYQNELPYPRERNSKTMPIVDNHALIEDIRYMSCQLVREL
jgi:hypothetical protein